MSDTAVLWDWSDETARAAKLAHYAALWGLEPDGAPFSTHSSWLAPVRMAGAPAMLKVPCHPEERTAMASLAWYGGRATARLLRIDDFAVLMERLADDRPLKAMAEGGEDDEATRILCAAANALHQPRDEPFPAAAPTLKRWFQALPLAAAAPAPYQGLMQAGWREAERLLDEPFEPVLLHGDIHHENVLHDPARGWVAIDPKGVVGPRGYDFANMLCNPYSPIRLKPGRMARQARIVAEMSVQSLEQVLSWLVAYLALSTAWHIEGETEHVEDALGLCRVAQAQLTAFRG